MTEADQQHRQLIEGAITSLHAEWKKNRRVRYEKWSRVPKKRSWHDPNYTVGEAELKSEMIITGYWPQYQEALAGLRSDLRTFDEAVARADANGVINYVPLLGYVTENQSDRNRKFWGNVAFGISEVPNVIALARAPWYAKAAAGNVPQTATPAPPIGREIEPLEWDLVSKSGETREEHLRLHEVDNLGRKVHGIFTGDSVVTANEAWEIAQINELRPDPQGVVDVPMGRQVGWLGGRAGAQGAVPLSTVRVVVVPGTNRVITAYPIP